MKKLTLLLFSVFVVVGYMSAQRQITGVVTDVSGESLIGANVLAKGTTAGTVTDIDGSFTIDIPAGIEELSKFLKTC